MPKTRTVSYLPKQRDAAGHYYLGVGSPGRGGTTWNLIVILRCANVFAGNKSTFGTKVKKKRCGWSSGGGQHGRGDFFTLQTPESCVPLCLSDRRAETLRDANVASTPGSFQQIEFVGGRGRQTACHGFVACPNKNAERPPKDTARTGKRGNSLHLRWLARHETVTSWWGGKSFNNKEGNLPLLGKDGGACKTLRI